MVKRLAPLAMVLALASAQTPAPRPAAPPPEEVIRITVNLVQVDATVVDADGKLVEDLKAGDFEVRQDGKLQTITNFSYVSTKPGQAGVRAAAPAGKRTSSATEPPPVPLRTDQIRRVFALVVDDLALAAENIPGVRGALGKFVDQDMQPGDLAAVIRTGANVGALQQFTTDKRLLHRAIDHLTYNGMSRVGITSFRPAGSGSGMTTQAASERRSQLNASSLAAITNIVEGLQEVPGRKTVILFSEDLHIMSGNSADPRAVSALDNLTDAADRASVVISSIDPRGLQTLQMTAADSPKNPLRAGSIPMQRATQMFLSQDGMDNLARATGGMFLHDNNDIPGQLHQVVERSNGYYLLGYHPASTTFDEKTGRPLFHRVSVRVKRPGTTVASRNGFLSHPDAQQRVRELTPQAELVHAMTSPFSPGGIHVRLTAMFSNTAKLGSLVTELLHIDAKDLKFEDAPDNRHKVQVDILSATFDEKDKVQEPTEKIYSLSFDDAQYQAALKSGIIFRLHPTVKKPGVYQMRIALRDSNSLQIGTASQSVEVPDLTKGHLALSSVELEDATGAIPANDGAPAEGQVRRENPLGSAAVRSFQPGAEVLYGFQILNPRLDASQKPQLEMETRIFRDGVQINQSKPRPVVANQIGDAMHLMTAGEIRLGAKMQPADYVLQVIVTDKLADEKYNVASQWMDFEVRP